MPLICQQFISVKNSVNFDEKLKGYPDRILGRHFWCHYFLWEKCLHPVCIKHGASILGCDISLPQDRPDFVICIENTEIQNTAEDCDLVHDGNDDHPDQPIGTCNCFLDSHQCFEEWSCARSDWWWRSLKSYWIPRIILWLIFNMGLFDTESL